MEMKGSLWMVVTDDKYELPLGVYDTRREMAEVYGVSEQTIKSAIRKGSRCRHNNLRFIRVEAKE